MPDVTSAAEATPAEDLVARIMSEGPLGMSAVARRLGEYRAGSVTHPSTVTRWATRGMRLAGGVVIRLEHIRLHGRLVTSWPAVLRYVRAQQGERAPHPAPPSPAARRRAADAAAAALDALGIK